ncbi:DUF916 and DUF3324 domain-containing protein [Enterococcus sp. LJL90]
MKKLLSLLAIVGFSLIFQAEIVFGSSNQAGAGYSITAELPENQYDNSVSYFDLLVKPGEQESLTIKMTNLTAEDKKIQLGLNNGYTNDNGVIEYNLENLDPDPSAVYRLTDFTEAPSQTVDLPANGEATATFELTTPENPFEGIVIGGIYAMEEGQESTSSQDDSIALTNQFALVLGVVLREDTETQIDPNLNLVSAQVAEKDGKSVISGVIQNDQPMILGNLTMDATVTKKDSSDILFQQSSQNLQMAPNSNFNYSVDASEENLDPGDYTLSIKANANDQSWDLTKDFTIEAADIEKLSTNEKSSEIPYGIVSAVVIGLILLGAVGFYLGRQRARK